jgi:hypothetical protein
MMRFAEKLFRSAKRRQARRAFQNSFSEKTPKLVDGRFVCRWEDRRPCLDDNTGATGFDAHYLYHTAWASRILAETRPKRHVDIGSYLYFAALVSAFVPFEFYDYRPVAISLSGLTSGQADLTALPFADDSIPSLSCMHVVEHIGLERYGDPFDPQGDIKAARELARVTMPSGSVLFVVPVGGTARIQYNAHRIYRFADVLALMPTLNLLEFALVTDHGEFIGNAEEDQANRQQYGCGCFHFTKRVVG